MTPALEIQPMSNPSPAKVQLKTKSKANTKFNPSRKRSAGLEKNEGKTSSSRTQKRLETISSPSP